MTVSYSSQHKKYLTAILAAAAKSGKGKDTAFLEAFFAHAALHNLEGTTPARAGSIATACEAFYAARPKAGPKLKVEAIKYTEDGRPVARTQVIALNDDMPFLVDSLTALFTSLGLTIHLLFHPILHSARDGKGNLASGKKASRAESLMYIELSPLPAGLTPAKLTTQMQHVLQHVAAGVADWAAMRERTQVMAEKFTGTIPGIDTEEVAETRDLLLWLASNHFVFLGMADFVASGKKLALDESTALGIYRLPPDKGATGVEDFTTPTTTQLISVHKASAMSLVHRHTLMDLIVVRRLNAKGQSVGELRILGLFTSTVYYRETQNIPFLRRKTANVLKRSGFNTSGHSAKALKTVLEFLPRDELFQMDEDQLFATAMGVVSLEAKPRVRLFVRPDSFGRFISAMVYVPRERFNSDLRDVIVKMIEAAYAGKASTFYTQLTDSPLARLHVVVETTPGNVPDVEEEKLESQIAQRANVWADALREAVITHYGDEEGNALAQNFVDAFPPAYVNISRAKAAAHDIRRVQECLAGDGLALEIFHSKHTAGNFLHLNCFTRDTHAELSRTIPSLEHMGATVVDATPYLITPLAPLAPVLLRQFTLRVAGAAQIDIAQHKARIEDAIGRVWRNQTDDDMLNALVFATTLSARDIEILRAYSRYLQQLDFPYSQSFIAGALVAHAAVAEALVALFHARFDPAAKQREPKIAALSAQIESALEAITNLAEDRILRQMYAVIQATLRTNFYQTKDGAPKPYISLKLQSNRVPEMKLPVPFVEIFVTSRRMEAIHLRGGTVARGGLRWSDRAEDFRTEVLGLMKTQMVKNSVIVPVGSKGGFILRQPPAERDALMAEGIECYKTFLRGMLDITDNIVGKTIVPPSQTVRYDNDDPYLVVAADKGTASFSDFANSVSAEYGFWLGDAFASGGSVGYDHKIMGITARGGWVSVMRHFHEMGRSIGPAVLDYYKKDIPTNPALEFTATGIGDMSGDVFGNGLLLSHHTRLVAAFNHKHIFVDPNPDATATYLERARLFQLPRSGWNDYDTTLISKGGGVFERSAKSIALTPEMRTALGTDVQKATPDELIKIILRAPVDLLWNGGIGTYVKAVTESNESVGDRTNNALRINGGELRAAIVGEGGNLGFTQRGRIEYARKGGRINTDAIDNSGGVDCSDHEVNIKIAFGSAISAKRVTLKQRDAILKKMTDEVAWLVLRDNQLQTQATSIAQLQGTALLEPAAQLMNVLETKGFLNREVEALPDAKQLADLRSTNQGLSRPEIAVLLAYAKMDLFNQLKDATALDDAYFEADLLRYFPQHMQKNFATDIKSHRLRREIVATMVTNSMVNRTGFAFAQSLMTSTGLPAIDIAQAYIATRDAFGLRALWTEIENQREVPAVVQSQLFVTLNRFIEHQCRWFLSHSKQPMVLSDVIATYRSGIAEITQHAEAIMSESLRTSFNAAIAGLEAQSVPPALARRIAMLEILNAACDIIDIAAQHKRSVVDTGRIYFQLGATLSMGWMRGSAETLPADNYWQQQAIKALVVEFYEAQRRLTATVMAQYGKAKTDAAESWASANADAVVRHQRVVADLRAQVSLDYPMLIVALRQVQAITGS